MGELILCQERLAGMPFYLENGSVNAYSIEEICYYIENNLYLAAQDIVCEEFCTWVREELKREKLADLLDEILEENRDSTIFLMSIVKDAGYYTPKECGELKIQIEEYANKSEFECQKMRADRLVENEKYVSGILEYKKLLDSSEAEEQNHIELGKVWHNLGTAYANMFLYDMAEQCFVKAYSYSNDPISKEAAVHAKHFEEQNTPVESIPEDIAELFKKAAEVKQDGDIDAYYRVLSTKIEEWKWDYRRYSKV